MITTTGRWNIHHDPDATRERYLRLPIGSGCSCSDCTAFIHSAFLVFPPEFKTLADSLGIDIFKPAELCHYGEESDGILLVGGWYHLVGHINSGEDAFRQINETSWEHDFDQMNSMCAFGLTDRLTLVPAIFSEYEIIQLEFLLRTHASALQKN